MKASVEASIAGLRQALRAAAPESIPPLVKDVSVLVKLLRNPAEQPAEKKFRVIKLSNATIARVLGTPGVRDVLQACGFVGDASSETLELHEPPDSVTLLAAAEAVQAVQHMLQELYWLHVTRAAVPSLAAQPWSADGAAEAVVHACLGALHAPGPAAAKAEWVERLGHVLLAPEMVTCRAAVAGRLSVALAAVRGVALSLVMEGAQDLRCLILANRCLAQLCPPGDPHTLQARLAFCTASLAAALPPEDGMAPPQELRLRLARGDLLGSTVEALGAFSEVGVRCGVLRQELRIEYAGEEGQDAGGLRRQFFDLFSSELARSPLWSLSAAGGLRPADGAARRGGAAAAAAMRAHTRTAGRVCGMALYQELHRARSSGSVHQLLGAAGGEANQAPSLLGIPFARYFVRALQHDPPSSLAELQAELLAECPESAPDYRGGAAILARGLEESGLQGQTFVRAVACRAAEAGAGVEAEVEAEVEVPLVEGGAAVAVTEENKREWLTRLLQAEMVGGIAEEVAQFRRGFVDVVGVAPHVDPSEPGVGRWVTPYFFLLSAAELTALWSGAPVSLEAIEELRRVAEVHPEVAAQAAWLWEVVLELDEGRRAQFFRFVTGSSRWPSTGVAFFRIGPKSGGDGAYPFAHACANALDMPSYSSREVLRERLVAAIEAAHDKFTDL